MGAPNGNDCASCCWWSGEGSNLTGQGECMFNPPTTIRYETMGQGIYRSARPLTYPDDYCHQWEPRDPWDSPPRYEYHPELEPTKKGG